MTNKDKNTSPGPTKQHNSGENTKSFKYEKQTKPSKSGEHTKQSKTKFFRPTLLESQIFGPKIFVPKMLKTQQVSKQTIYRKKKKNLHKAYGCPGVSFYK